VHGLTDVNPSRLQEGRKAFLQGRRAMQEALQTPINGTQILVHAHAEHC